MVRKYINILWNKYLNKPPSFLNKDICKSITTEVEHDSRIRQCAGKQACSMIKAIIAKQNKRLYKLKQLQSEGKDSKFLQRKIDLFVLTKPTFKKINVELDARFIDFQQGNSFDLFAQISQIGNKRTIRIPIKHTFTSNKWLKTGKLKSSVRLNETSLTLYFEVENKPNNGTKIIGADQGLLTCLSLSDGQITQPNKHGYDLNKIIKVMSRKKKGSQGFKRTMAHRKLH